MTGHEHDPTVEQRIARLERLVEELRASVRAAEASEPTEPTRAAAARAAQPSGAGPQPGRTREDPTAEDPTAEDASWRRFAQQGAEAAPGATRDPGASGAPRGGGSAAGEPGPTGSGGTGPFPSPPPLAEAGERWLGRVGVGFVVLAFAFLFKYALDQGWIGPAARLVVGLVTGAVMLLVGLRLEGSRERYSQYLLGGAIGIFYLVGFAAYQLYELVPFPFAFAFMAATTVLAFVLAERQRLPSLAVVGASGGLSTPFLLYTGSGNVPGLTVYTTLLLAGAGTVQFLRGWRSLLLVLGLGGLLVMGIAVAGSSGLEDWVVLAGVLAAWALFGALPLVRAALARTEPEQWPEPPLPGLLSTAATPEGIGLLLLRVACVAAALIACLEIAVLFPLGEGASAALFAAAFAVYVLLAWRLSDTPRALNAAAETAAILIVVAVLILMRDWWALLPLAVVGGLMHLARGRWSLGGVGVLAHVLFLALAFSYASGGFDAIGISTRSWTLPLRLSLLASILTAFAVSFALPGATGRMIYRLGAHLALLLWLAVEFEPLPQGQGLISLTWGLYGAALLLASFRVRDRKLQLTGLATLGIVAAKLLLVDMAQLDMIWRILLFMGFGSAFLGLSYLINRPQVERRG